MLLDPNTELEPDKINIAVIRLPHISNFTDFSPFEVDDAIGLHYLSLPRRLDGYDMVLLPGTKNVRSDVDWLKKVGWFEQLKQYVKRGGNLGGICGGYQMLGNVIHDPDGIEGLPGETEALGFF